MAKATKVGPMTTRDEVMATLSGCSLSFNLWGITQAMDRREHEAGAQAIKAKRKATKMQKVKIDTDMPEWRTVQRCKSATQFWYDGMTFPYVVRGQRLFRIDMKADLWKGVADRQKELREAAKGLQKQRARIIEWGRENLGDAFDERDYPADFTDHFHVEIREHSISPPDYLATEDKRQFEAQIMNDIRASMNAFERKCLDELGGYVGRVTGALQGGGAPRATTLNSMQETFNRIARMRFQGTTVFNNCVKDVQQIMDGIDPAELRRSHKAKDEAKAKFAGLLNRYKELASAVAEANKEAA